VTGFDAPKLFQIRPVNATSLLKLARTFEEEGDDEIAIAVYRKLAEGVIPRDHTITEANRTLLSYFCLYRISRCYLALNETKNAMIYANKAYQVSSRKEPYYHVGQYLDKHENDEATALHFYGLAAMAPKPPADVPFGEASIYAMDIEKDIIWPKAFPHSHLQDLRRHQDILDNPMTDEETYRQRHDAMALITRPLFAAGYEELFRREGPFRPEDGNNEFYYSTPTIARLHPGRADDFLIMCRLINYRVDPVTRWRQDFLPPGGEPHFLKSALALHRGIEDKQGILIEFSDDALEKSTSEVIGPEDPKLLRVHSQEQRGDEEEEILVTLTSLEYSKVAGKGPRMASGTIYPERGILELKHAFPSPNNREWEKNWVVFQKPGDQEIHFVYEWYPLTVGTFKDEANHVIDFNTTIGTPHSFKYLRGSSNGVAYQQEIWFMVHGVGKIGYTYYHKIVVLDAQTLHVRRHSYPFKLEGLHTEFCLGLDIDESSDTITIAYSVMDGSSVLRRVALWKVEALMVSLSAQHDETASRTRLLKL
jgi:tetratricopeptide (TPR) repeat protein